MMSLDLELQGTYDWVENSTYRANITWLTLLRGLRIISTVMEPRNTPKYSLIQTFYGPVALWKESLIWGSRSQFEVPRTSKRLYLLGQFVLPAPVAPVAPTYRPNSQAFSPSPVPKRSPMYGASIITNIVVPTPSRRLVSNASNIPQHDIGNYLERRRGRLPNKAH